jgi:hypothetical protein
VLLFIIGEKAGDPLPVMDEIEFHLAMYPSLGPASDEREEVLDYLIAEYPFRVHSG